MALSKSQKLASEAAAKAVKEASRARRLDPPFPYKVKPFSPRFFKLL